MQKKAFTLVEVLFAVVLIATIGLALLQSSSNNTKLMRYSTKKRDFIHKFSIFAINMNEDLHNKSKTLFDLLNNKYSLDDETRRMLKQNTYLLKSENVDTVLLKDSDKADKSLSFTIRKNTMSNQYSAFIYSIKSEGL